MYILGLNAFHGDSSACLLRDGQLIAAAEEERFTRIKHWAGCPSRAVAYCLESARISFSDVDHIAVNSDPKAHLAKKISYALRKRPDFSLVKNRIQNRRERKGVLTHLAAAFPEEPFTGQLHAVEHHLAHLASAHLVSPFPDSVVVSVDGFGDFSSAAWGVAIGSRIEVDQQVFFPHSLGVFYQALTQFLGFDQYGDEYKVMGLAPYGQPRYLSALRELVSEEESGGFALNLDYFRHHSEKFPYEWEGGSPTVGSLFRHQPMEELLRLKPRSKGAELEQQHMDLASSIQARYEEVFLGILNRIQQNYALDTLSLAGGCAMNSVANGKILAKTPFRQVYVQAAAGDAGGAIGAAMMVATAVSETPRFQMRHAYWGPKFSNTEVEALLRSRATELTDQGCSCELVTDEEELCRFTAECISEGNVIGWFQGRMEWGPRALGNRSILGDPRRADMKEILNLKIKRRESFRPFAPSILRSAVPDWFEQDADVPFMMQVFPIREDKRALIPAVTHVDGSGRLQTVHSSTNPRYHALIQAFARITDVPILLNTSFNENEPVVCRPEEALDCFLRTRMDLLVMEDWMIRRSPGSFQSKA